MLVATGMASAWNDSGPRWTKAKARTTLLTSRVVATDGSYDYIFDPVQLVRFRPHGRGTSLGYRRFEVLVDFDPVRGDFHFGHFATFCLHAQRRGFRLTGFDTIVTSMNLQEIGYGLGCKETPKALRAVGRNYP